MGTMSESTLLAPAGHPVVVESPCRHLSAAELRWTRHPEYEPFMRATYDEHVAWACGRGRPFVEKVPDADLGSLDRRHQLRRDAVPAATQLLAAAHAGLRAAQAAGDPRALAVRSFGVSSSYRSSLQQYQLWNRRFPDYFAETATRRASLAGGPLGPQAARLLARHIRTWLAAPGFSNHNDGRAIDFSCTLTSGQTLGASHRQIPQWRESWLFDWLRANAVHSQFHPYEPEPWHWEHRASTTGPSAVRETSTTSAATTWTEYPAPAEAEVPAGATGPVKYWSTQSAVRPRRQHGDHAHGRSRRVRGHPAGHRVRHRPLALHLPARVVDRPVGQPDRGGTCLLDLFERAGARGVQVRVLVWDAPAMLPSFRMHSRLHDAAVKALNRLPNCHAQQDAGGGTLSAKSHHQKLLVVNGRDGLVALCGGVDVNADRVHELPPPRSAYRADRPTELGWSGASGSSGGGGSGDPLHDVHVRVTGPTALPLLRVFLRRWWARSGDRGIDRRAPLRGRYEQTAPAPTGSQFVRVGETFEGVLEQPRAGCAAGPSPSRTSGCVRCSARAGSSTSRTSTWSTSAPPRPSGRCCRACSTLPSWCPRRRSPTCPASGRRRREFIERITVAARTRTSCTSTRGASGRNDACRREGAHVYVHAKIGIIDDELHAGRVGQLQQPRLGDRQRAGAGAFEAPVRGRLSTAHRLRNQLWAHHLGQPASAVTDPIGSRAAVGHREHPQCVPLRPERREGRGHRRPQAGVHHRPLRPAQGRSLQHTATTGALDQVRPHGRTTPAPPTTVSVGRALGRSA